ncbi:cation:proton antiporter [Paenibacillus sp. sptzw28]|uniref:cation:proton antiporter domain-containing protein n=1 Tax=Paenibacillus sp. sptzw28 TaxID=715179 RepID=UPI001C6E2C38|nr:cation:proton antiporter [Paenibacillus sp. sptzw28]QYR21859.1 cation:proton antiporter [Paenibacillus sp. sptzw28]
MNHNLHLFLAVVTAIVIVIVAARICGSLFVRIRQPRVVGEMVAGVLLGPTFFGVLAPELQASIFTSEVKSTLFVLSNLGLSVYMFLVGAEMDLQSFNRSSIQKSGFLASAGIFPPFIMGVAIGFFLYDSFSFDAINKMSFCIYMGVALSITAFPMMARILQDEGLVKTKFGSLTLLAASVDDAAAWCFLAVVTAMAQSKDMIAGLYTAVGGVLFALLVLTLVKKRLKKMSDRVEAAGQFLQHDFAIILLLILGAAWITDYIGIYSVFGGFILGLAMPRTPVFQREIHGKLTDFVVVLLLPLFFAFSGLNADIASLFNMGIVIPFLFILLASILGKYGGCTLAMRRMGFTWRESSAIGGLMNARGLMELIVVNIGLAYEIINQDLYSMLVLMAIVTTAAAMPIFNASLGNRGTMAQNSKENPTFNLEGNASAP